MIYNNNNNNNNNNNKYTHKLLHLHSSEKRQILRLSQKLSEYARKTISEENIDKKCRIFQVRAFHVQNESHI